MTISTSELAQARARFISSGEAAKVLGITPLATSRLVRQKKIPGVKVGRTYLLSRTTVEEFAKTYVPRKGRPRQKRKYTKRSPKWRTR